MRERCSLDCTGLNAPATLAELFGTPVSKRCSTFLPQLFAAGNRLFIQTAGARFSWRDWLLKRDARIPGWRHRLRTDKTSVRPHHPIPGSTLVVLLYAAHYLPRFKPGEERQFGLKPPACHQMVGHARAAHACTRNGLRACVFGTSDVDMDYGHSRPVYSTCLACTCFDSCYAMLYTHTPRGWRSLEGTRLFHNAAILRFVIT